MSKKSKKKNLGAPKTGAVYVLSSLEATRLQKPRFNGFACGHGIHGDTKYNRAKENRSWQGC